MLSVVLFSLLLSSATTISFNFSPEGSRCIKEEAHKDILVVGEFEISNVPEHFTVDVKVTDTKDQTLFSKEGAEEGKTGKFAFTLDDYDMFNICFSGKASSSQRSAEDIHVTLNIKRGVEAKSYSELAKAEKLKPMELELKKLEDLAEAIVSDFAYMKSREKLMRDTNESTNSRVLWFSIFSMAVLLGLALWQVFYLKRFFKAKKLIE